jgi:hypothetical protein
MCSDSTAHWPGSHKHSGFLRCAVDVTVLASGAFHDRIDLRSAKSRSTSFDHEQVEDEKEVIEIVAQSTTGALAIPA